jgi:hypothetical protein
MYEVLIWDRRHLKQRLCLGFFLSPYRSNMLAMRFACRLFVTFSCGSSLRPNLLR